MLHIPDAPCNGFRPSIGIRYGWGIEGLEKAFSGEKQDDPWYTEKFNGFERVVLAEEEEGESPLAQMKDNENLSAASISLDADGYRTLHPNDTDLESDLSE